MKEVRCRGELFSETEKLVAGLDMALQPEAGGETAVLNAQDTGIGNHLCSPPPALVCRIASTIALADSVSEKSSPRHLTSFKELKCYFFRIQGDREMPYIKIFLITSISLSFLLVSNQISAKEGARIDYYKKPLEMEEMKEYEKIRFDSKNFEKIKRGMTEIEVLSLLGKPLDMKKIKRRKNRWTVTYFYPDRHVVNLRNGLVVGKEKR